MKNWKLCKEYGIWVNMDHIKKITMYSSFIDSGFGAIYHVVAHDNDISLVIYSEIKEKCEEWLKEFMND
jgi:hypothetical protein